MKKFFNISLFALLLCGAVSCQNDIVPAAPQGEEIKFSNNTTRTQDPNAGDINIDEFGIYAVMSQAPDVDYEQPSDVVYDHILEGEKIYRSNVTGDFTYTNTQYWVNDRTFHFFAYWPYQTPASIANDGVSYNLEYSVEKAADATKQAAEATDDILVCHYTTLVDLDETEFEAVPITFKRALSQIRFEISQDFVKNPNDEFCVTSVSLSNINAGGTLSTSRFNKTGSWSLGSETLRFVKEYADGGETLKFIENTVGGEKVKEAVPLVIFDGLNLVPQNINNNQMALVVDYTYQQKNSEGENVGDEISKKASTFLPIGKWDAGKVYTYKMSLYQNNLIVFKNISVNTWGDQPNAGTIIIK